MVCGTCVGDSIMGQCRLCGTCVVCGTCVGGSGVGQCLLCGTCVGGMVWDMCGLGRAWCML